MKHLTNKAFKEIKQALKEHKQDNMVKSVNARDVHEWLGVGKDFSNWIKNRINKCGFVEGVDFLSVEILSSPNLANAKSRPQMMKEYHCSPDMVKQLAMMENSEKGQLVRKYFLDCETIAHDKLIQQSQRETLRIEYRPMTDAILEDHENPKPFHFTNENNMIYRIMFGATAAEIKRDQGLENTETLRDHLTSLEQKCLIEMQRVNTALITLGHDFQQRKQQLDTLYNKRFKDGLIEESHRLNA